MILNLSKTNWIVTYLCIKDPNELKVNRLTACQIILSTAKRRSKNPTQAKVYCEKIIDMMDREFTRKLTKNEMCSYNGPVHYMNHYEVLKSE